MIKIISAELREDEHDQQREFIWFSQNTYYEMEFKPDQPPIQLSVVFEYLVDGEVSEPIQFLVHHEENETPINTSTFDIDHAGNKSGVHTIHNVNFSKAGVYRIDITFQSNVLYSIPLKLKQS